MLVKFFEKRGAGRSSGPIDYLLGKDRDREGAKLLRGDPEKTGLLIDSLKFKQRYTAGVLSFEESNTSEGYKQKIMDSFENALLPGMAHRANIMWVEHRDKGRLELNFLIANVDLESGKRLQPYYHRADLNRVDAWKELTNSTYGFTSPNDPAKKQTQTPKTNESKPRKNIKDTVDNAIANLYSKGVINSRDDIEKYLNEQGFNVVRKTKTSMTFTEQNSEKRYRLKGLLYGENFRTRESIREPVLERDRAHKRDNEENIRHNRGRLEEAVKRKSQEYEKRYFAEPRHSSKEASNKNISDKRNDEMDDLGRDIRTNTTSLNCQRLDVFPEGLAVQKPIRESTDPELRIRPLDVRDGISNGHKRENLPRRRTENLQELVNDRDRGNIIGFTQAAIERVQQFTKSIKARVRDLHGAISQTFGAELAQHQSGHKNNRDALERAGEENQRDIETFERNERKISEIGDNTEQFNDSIKQFGERYESLTREIEERLEPAAKQSFWSRMR